ncbi:MAG: hypothetical protein BMS9Abin05_0203 [Rhodothermia bacterium]|nr:MAG: hypothetical protein BMS9Abin05_0203 [Rhodothermia bacterium]
MESVYDARTQFHFIPLLNMRALFVLIAGALAVQVSGQSLDLAVDNVGISFGDSEEFTGLRFNYRDRCLRKMTGINATIWTPYEPARGGVTGLALGLPTTGAKNIEGLGLGILGVGAEESLTGIMIGGLGAGAGRDIVGVAIGGLGGGSGRDATGIMIGGLGAGAGRNMEGIGIGGLGVGAGNDVRGVFIGGLGAGAGRDATGCSSEVSA